MYVVQKFVVYYFSNCEILDCHCDLSGTVEGVCNKTNGKCICKEGYGDENCGVCLLGFYGFPDCKPCNCSKIGAQGTTCSASGKCSCLDNFSGRTCNQCSPGYYNYPECTCKIYKLKYSVNRNELFPISFSM